MRKTLRGVVASAAVLLTACVTATTGGTGKDAGSGSGSGGSSSGTIVSGSGSGGGSSGSGSGGSSTTAFVGTWACTGTLSAVQSLPSGVPPTSESFADDETHVAGPEGTLTLTFEYPDGGTSSDCSYTLSVSGSTATGASGQLCVSEGDIDSFNTLTFEVTSAGTASVEYVVGVTGTTTDDGGIVELAGTVTITGTCVKS